MSIERWLMAGAVKAAVEAEAVDFDGTNDFFSRTSDLTGNTDGKTFTFSCWVYIDDSGTGIVYNVNGGPGDSFLVLLVSGKLRVQGNNAAGPNILLVDTPTVALNTFLHLLVSIDLTDTGKRHVFLNDEAVSATYTTYTDDTIAFTKDNHNVGSSAGGTLTWEGRLAQVFLDYTFRDLTIAANRRLFTTIDSERGLIPAAGQASLSPILYLPMDDPATAFINDGTGGDFTLNGVIARSGRGPNQYNSPASELDGTADFLTRGAALTGATDAKLLTCAFSLKSDAAGIDHIYSTANTRIEVTFTATRTVRFVGKNSAGTTILDVSGPAIPLDSVRTVSASFDLANAANRFIFYGADSQSLTVVTYTDDTIDFTDTDHSVGATTAGATKFNGDLGDFYLGNEFIDLSSGNPFFDSTTGKPEYLGESGELPTSSSPLVYLPLRADDAGNNLGTGGDFTVTSGPFVGARGGSEFWARSMNVGASDATTGLDKTDSGLSDTTTASFVIALKPSGASQRTAFALTDAGTNFVNFTLSSGFSFALQFRQTSGTAVIFTTADANSLIVDDEWAIIQICVDSSNQSLFKTFVNQVERSITVSTFNAGTSIGLSSVTQSGVGKNPRENTTGWANSDLGFFYFTESYIDFAQEANRLKFVDGLGFPVDIQPAIDDGDIPTPLIYMKFEDTADLGLNAGTGGDFTINGTVTAGADVNG